MTEEPSPGGGGGGGPAMGAAGAEGLTQGDRIRHKMKARGEDCIGD